MAKTYFEEASRGKTTWAFKPEDLVLVTDKSDPLYDPRVEDPIDEAMVNNIAYFGVREPITVTRRDGKAVVVNGRTRVRAAIIANRRLVEQGKEPIQVPAVTASDEDDDLFGLMISLNEQRHDDGPLTKAKKAARMLELCGGNRAKVCVAFGITGPTLSNWLKVFDLAPAVKKALDRGDLGMTAASALAELPKEEQEKAMETVASQPAASGSRRRNGRPTAREVKEAAGVGGPRMKSRKQIEERLREKRLPADYRKALEWVMGIEN